MIRDVTCRAFLNRIKRRSKMREGDLLSQDVSLFSLMDRILQNLDTKQVDLPGTVAVLSLFTLMNILSIFQEQGLPAARGGSAAGGKDLSTILSSMLADGQNLRPEMLLNMLQKSGNKVNPQLLTTLLSLAGDAAKKDAVETAEEDRAKQKQLPDKRAGRSF